MQSFKKNSVQMNEIINKTILALDSGKKEIIEIADNSRKESKRLEEELGTLKNQIHAFGSVIQSLEYELKISKKKLFDVNKNFDNYSQGDLQEVYQKADNLRVELAVKREQETFLIRRRNDLEIRIKDLIKTLEHADKLIGHVSVALDYLSYDLQGVGEKLDDLQQKQFMGLRIIEAQEEERKRVAREIHDGPAQAMSNVVIKAEICEKLLDKNIEDTRKELQNLKKVVRDTLQEVRRIIYNLRPMALDDLGLLPTLERYVISFKEDNGIDVALKTKSVGEDILNPVISLTVFRIVQEALSNVLKHSKATRVSILLENLKSRLSIIILDNGIGFNSNQIKKNNSDLSGGFGLFSIRERVNLLNGEINITSEEGKGTKITILIPLINEGEAL